MGLDYEPYVSAEKDLPELTPRVIIIGIILGAVMTAANAYLGMLVGMTGQDCWYLMS